MSGIREKAGGGGDFYRQDAKFAKVLYCLKYNIFFLCALSGFAVKIPVKREKEREITTKTPSSRRLSEKKI